MKNVKKLLTIGLAVLLMLCSIVLSGCSDKKYQVTQEEYEKAFTKETLSNVTFCVSPWLYDIGGTGHVGSYLTKRLLANGCEVYVATRGNTQQRSESFSTARNL